MKQFIIDNVVFIRGENANENWSMLDTENGDYYFFHLSSFPSCYVSMRCTKPTNELLYYGAKLCRDGTKYKNLNNLKVDICKFSNLTKGTKPGEVIFKSKRKIMVIKI
jgi:predicted ribosome quality control (RQC) complex YloA/Tae2 family protein